MAKQNRTDAHNSPIKPDKGLTPEILDKQLAILVGIVGVLCFIMPLIYLLEFNVIELTPLLSTFIFIILGIAGYTVGSYFYNNY